MKLISWNVNRSSIKRLRRQLDALQDHDPDILALIEFGKKASRKPRKLLREYGYKYAASSHEFLDDQSPLSSSECIASKWPFRVLDPTEFDVPYTQRILSAEVFAPHGRTEVHAVHVIPGSQYKWKKIEMFEGIHDRLSRPYEHEHRILCGDFNSPMSESPDGTVKFFGLKKHGQRWFDGEKSVLLGLQDHDLTDAFRAVNGYEHEDYSYVVENRGNEWKRRFDHVLSSASLNPKAARYHHDLLEHSDHAPLEVVFQPRVD